MLDPLLRVFGRLRRREPLLLGAAVTCLLLLVPLAILGALDPRTVAGVSVWIKPAKFLLAFAVLLGTAAALFDLLPRTGPSRWLRKGFVAVAGIELFCIGLQACRGVPSHFNLATPFDETVYRIMGTAIGVNTLLFAVLLVRFLRPRPTIPPGLRRGIRLGILVFLLGSLAAVPMLLQRGHAVGAPEAGPGLPFLGWSTIGGDLRIPHFFGLHGLQALPMIGWWLDRRIGHRPGASERWVLLAGVLWAAVLVALWIGALLGVPLLPHRRAIP